MALLPGDGHASIPPVTDGPTDDELARALQQRDRGFLLRLALRVGVVILFGVYVSLAFDGNTLGGCAARGFGTLTGSPPDVR